MSEVNDTGSALDLPLYTLQCGIRFEQAVELPPFPGTTLHGGFGHALMAVGQALYDFVFDPKDCRGSALQKPYLFATPKDSPRRFKPGDKWQFTLTLLGNRVEALVDVITALFHWQALGLGTARARFCIERIVLAEPQPQLLYEAGVQYHIPAPSSLQRQLEIHRITTQSITADSVWIECLSPWHIKYRRQPLKHAPAPDILMSVILRRLNGLAKTFWPNAEPIAISETNMSVELVEDKTAHQFVSRYSRKEKARHQMDDLRGKWCYRGDISMLVPCLVIGRCIGVGNKTTFGFGQFRWTLAASMSVACNTHKMPRR